MSSLPEATRRPFSCEEFLKLAELGVFRPQEHVELIGGGVFLMAPERFAMSPQGPVHSGLVASIAERLREFFSSGRFCIRTHSPLRVSEFDLPEPDLAIVRGSCEEFEHDFPSTAALVIEVAVTSQVLDRGTKARLYASAGVDEYWIIDVPARRMESLRDPSPDGYKLIRLLGDSDTIVPLGAERPGKAPLPVSWLLPRPLPGAERPSSAAAAAPSP